MGSGFGVRGSGFLTETGEPQFARILTPSVAPDDEHRESDRIEILGELKGEMSVLQPLAIKEISPDGCLIETAFPLQLNSLHDIRLTLGAQSIVLKGRVAHCRIGDLNQELVHYLTGIQFVEPPSRARDIVLQFIEALDARRKGL